MPDGKFEERDLLGPLVRRAPPVAGGKRKRTPAAAAGPSTADGAPLKNSTDVCTAALRAFDLKLSALEAERTELMLKRGLREAWKTGTQAQKREYKKKVEELTAQYGPMGRWPGITSATHSSYMHAMRYILTSNARAGVYDTGDTVSVAARDWPYYFHENKGTEYRGGGSSCETAVKDFIFMPWFKKHTSNQTDEHRDAMWGAWRAAYRKFYDTVGAELQEKGIKLEAATAAEMDGLFENGVPATPSRVRTGGAGPSGVRTAAV